MGILRWLLGVSVLGAVILGTGFLVKANQQKRAVASSEAIDDERLELALSRSREMEKSLQ